MNNWSTLFYDEVNKKNDLTIVDNNYTTDLHWHTIYSYLEYLIRFGTKEDIIIAKQIFDNKEPDIKVNEKLLLKWDNYSVKTKIQNKYRSDAINNFTIVELLEDIQLNIYIPIEYKEALKELLKGKNIKEYLHKYCTTDYMQNNRTEIEDKMVEDYFGKPKLSL